MPQTPRHSSSRGADRLPERRLISDLVQCSPSLAGHLKDDLSFYSEFLPHVFFIEVVRHVEGLLRALNEGAPIGPGAETELRAIIEVLDRHLREGDPGVDNLIGVSFVERFVGEEEGLRDLLTPRLLEELQRMEAWEPPRS